MFKGFYEEIPILILGSIYFDAFIFWGASILAFFNIWQTCFFSQLLFKQDWVFNRVLITSSGQVGIEANAPAIPAHVK